MLYQILRLIGKPIIYLLFLPKIIGKKNTRHKGRAVVITNHSSFWDPFSLRWFRRQVYWMGKMRAVQEQDRALFLKLLRLFRCGAEKVT